MRIFLDVGEGGDFGIEGLRVGGGGGEGGGGGVLNYDF